MLVYGDRARTLSAADALAEVRADLDRAAGESGLARHAALVSALIGLGELAQGLADHEFVAAGVDARTPLQEALSAPLLDLARVVDASWRGAPAAPPRLRLPELPDIAVELRQPEGYAFYGLYPEAYAEAARTLGPAPDTRVVGVRSIGTSLAAIVAAALQARPAVTVRPTGHPFDRQLALAPELAEEIAGEPRVAVVDEGPGLSGSSFAAVLAATRGEALAFPGHAGDLGPEAGDERRARWAATPRHVVSTDALLIESGRLLAWAEEKVGPALEPLRDLSGGAWRAVRDGDEADWPAANTFQERRKFLLRTERGEWLLRFAGLGRIGERKLQLARALYIEGFVPAPAALLHGFTLEPWIAPAPPPEGEPPLLDYLISRRRFEAPADSGASAATLLEMARANTVEALGEKAAEPLACFQAKLDAFDGMTRRVLVDGRLHRWEWITSPRGRWLKTDALDHHAAHDLIGAQDLAWDVAGASVEWDFDPDETARLARELDVEPDLLGFLLPCYLAFQLGSYAMAADAHGHWPAEQARLQRERMRYQTRLAVLLPSL